MRITTLICVLAIQQQHLGFKSSCLFNGFGGTRALQKCEIIELCENDIHYEAYVVTGFDVKYSEEHSNGTTF